MKVLESLEDKRPKVRIVAVAAVAKSGDKNARRILQGMLGDKSEQVRAAAARGLGQVGDPKALRALQLAVDEDKSKLVRREAKAALALLQKAKPKSAAAGQGGAVSVVVFPVDDVANTGRPELKTRLHDGVKAAIGASKKRQWAFTDDEKQKGYGVMLRIRSITEGKQGDVSLVEVKCEMTLVAMPSRALRVAASASAALGIEGALDPAMKDELVGDGIDACAPALVEDFLGYVLNR